MNFHTQYPCYPCSVCPIFQLMLDLQILPPRFGGRFCSFRNSWIPPTCFQDAAQDSWGRRFEGRGVGVLVEWQNKARRDKTKRNGSDWMAIQKKYIEGNCVQVEMSLKGFCFKNLQIINFSNKSSFRKAGETWKRC